MMMRLRITALALCLGMIEMTRSSLAQDAARDTDWLRFSVEARGTYSDNRDASEGSKEDNFDYYISPRVDVVLDLERTKLDFFYQPSFRYRSNPSDFQDSGDLFHDLGVNLENDINRQTKLRIREKFNFADDPAIENGGFIVREDRSYTLNNVEGDVSFAFSRFSYVQLSGANMIKRYDEDDVAAESDEDASSGGLRLWRQVAPSVGVHADGRLTTYAFDSTIGIQRDFDIVLLGVGVDKVFSPHLRGGVQVGWQNVKYDDPGLGSQSEPYVQAELRGQTVPSTRLIATVTHGVRDSDAYPFASQTYTDLRGRLEWDASAKVTLAAQATYRLSDYGDENRPETAPADTFIKDTSGDETTVVGQGEAIVKLTAKCSARLVQRLEDVSSDVSASFTKNTTLAAVSMAF